MVTVNDSKISFIWGSCFADHLWGDDPHPYPWSKPHYVAQFNQLRGGGGSDDTDFAWYPGQKSAFWRAYLGGQALGEVRGADAWAAMVPFRMDGGLPSLETDRSERIVIDTYAYQVGVVIVLTVQPFKRARASMDDWVERMRELRNDPVYLLDDGRKVHNVSITQALDACAKAARFVIFGTGGTSISSAEPITITNILQAQGGQPGAPFDARLQRYLHAVTAWPGNWQHAKLPTLGASPPFLAQRSTNKLPNDALYAVGRGLAVWRPGHFAPPVAGSKKIKRHVLSCYGHNLCAAAAQSEYLRLLSMIHAAQPKFRDRFDSGRMRTASLLIDALARGHSTTYRSECARYILANNNSRAQVNQVLALSGAPPI